MIIRTDRSDAERSLVAAFRATFDASVMNFGAYNLLYAHNLSASEQNYYDAEQHTSAQGRAAASPALVLGYRREPAELVLCPVQVDHTLAAVGEGKTPQVQPEVPVLVNLTNLAGMSAEGTAVTITLSTGITVVLDVLETVVFPQLPQIPLRQHRDVADFDAFLDHFMDRVERHDH